MRSRVATQGAVVGDALMHVDRLMAVLRTAELPIQSTMTAEVLTASRRAGT